jgi:hypothetical protein
MKQNLLRAFVLALAGTFLGSLLKILHLPLADVVLMAGLVIAVVFIALGLVSTWRDNTLSQGEKVLWSILLFITPIGPLIFMLLRYPKLSNA